MAPKIAAIKTKRSSVNLMDLSNKMNKPVPLNEVLMPETNKEPSNLLYLLKANMAALMIMVSTNTATANAIDLVGLKMKPSNFK